MFALYMPSLTRKVDRSLSCFLQRDIDMWKVNKMQPELSEALGREANVFSRALSLEDFMDGV
jgi:hypothetical protein